MKVQDKYRKWKGSFAPERCFANQYFAIKEGSAPRCTYLWQKIHINSLADFVVEQSRAEDEIRAYTSRFRFDPDFRHAGEIRSRDGKNDELLRWRLRHGIRGHGDELVTFAFVENVQAILGRSRTDGDCAGGCFAIECTDEVVDDGFAVVVEGLARSELLDVVEVLW